MMIFTNLKSILFIAVFALILPFFCHAQIIPKVTIVKDSKLVHPLEQLKVVCNSEGVLSVKDGIGREYLLLS